MKPIWFFVGVLLLVNGVFVLFADVFYAMNPPEHATVFAHARPGLWWGLLMLVVGGVFLLTNRRKTVE